MPAAYSFDLRTRILKDCDHGMSSEDAARKYSVSITWVYNLKKQRKETGSIEPKKYQSGPKRKLAPYEQEVRQLVTDHPDATLVELHAMLPHNDQFTPVTLHNFLRHLKITYKKKHSAPPNNIAKTLPNSEMNGKNCKSCSTSKTSFSSTKPGRKRT